LLLTLARQRQRQQRRRAQLHSAACASLGAQIDSVPADHELLFWTLKEIDRCHDDDADTVDRPTNRSAARRVARSPRRMSA
jgi:hypothetical protein